jgi:hypothetical protein
MVLWSLTLILNSTAPPNVGLAVKVQTQLALALAPDRATFLLMNAVRMTSREYNGAMKRSLTFIAAMNLTAMAFSMGCGAQELQAVDSPEVSREEWQARVKASREQAGLMRRERRSFVPLLPTQDEIAEEASKRILRDDSLVPGDIISTNRGLFRFQGSRDKERKADDFVRVR